MSHVVQIKTEVRDEVAVGAACRRLGLTQPRRGMVTLFQTEVAGLLVELPGWIYPVVVDLASGATRYDNYEGRWGDPAQIGKFLQAYALEKATIEARKRGHIVKEQPLADGSIKLVIGVGGAS
jgi:hypothetical protein